MDRSFESILASFAPPVVGVLAQHVYGYKPITEGSSDSAQIKTDRDNAKSLAKALYTAIGVPISLCCFIYSFLYCSYPRDRERARMHALIESEMLQAEANDFIKEIEGIDEIHISYEVDESLDFIDCDEKQLLHHQVA